MVLSRPLNPPDPASQFLIETPLVISAGFEVPYCTVDPFILVRTRILGLIGILIQFQVGELKKQWFPIVLRARKRENNAATAPFSKTSRFPMVFAWFSEGSRGRCGFSAHPDVVSLNIFRFDITEISLFWKWSFST